jgi:hypothetical protein
MASSQGTPVSTNSFSRWASHDIFLFKYHFLLHILRFLFFFSDNIMADVGSKQQTTALFLSTTVTHTGRHTELTKKTDKLDGKPVLCQRTFSSVFRAVLSTQLNCTVGLRPLACWDCVFESHRGAWIFVCCECCVLSGRGLCDELITRPEESYRLWCVVVYDLETSWMRRPWPSGGCCAKREREKVKLHSFT